MTVSADSVASNTTIHRGRQMARWKAASALAFASLGPGLMVMLADTDAGSIVTAAQSGALWGYQMILPQILLIPVLYVVQEMTVRLGIVTQKGHGELIREHFGRGWALLSVATLFLAAIGAMVTEFAGIAGVGSLFGLPAQLTVPFATLLLVGIVLTGSYQRVERIGIAIGLFELLFIPAALFAGPDLNAVARDLPSLPIGNSDYLLLLAANVGAVIMPWMVFYQQNAVVDKKLTLSNLRAARLDTLLGAGVTQLVMIAVIVAMAATVGQTGMSRPLNGVTEIAGALEPFLGWAAARVAFGLGMAGAAFVAVLVVSLSASWAITETLGLPHSLNDRPREARWFYSLYVLALMGGAALVLSGISLIELTINIEIMNAVLLPLVLGFLLVLEHEALPVNLRAKGWYRVAAWSLSGAVIFFGLLVAGRILLSGV